MALSGLRAVTLAHSSLTFPCSYLHRMLPALLSIHLMERSSQNTPTGEARLHTHYALLPLRQDLQELGLMGL